MIIKFGPPMEFAPKVNVAIIEPDSQLLSLAERLFHSFEVVNPKSYGFFRSLPRAVRTGDTIVLNGTKSWARFLRAIRPKTGTFQNR